MAPFLFRPISLPSDVVEADMRNFYSNDDVVRWGKSCRLAIDLHCEKLATDLPQPKVDFHLSNLSGSYYMQGMTFMAQGDFDAAVQAFRASAEARCKMYDRFEKGQGRSLEAGHFQSVLVAFVTKDQALVSRLVGHYRADEGTPDSVFLGKVVKLLALGDIHGAKTSLAQKKPCFEPQFVGYADCLEAIANKEQEKFVFALNVATESWVEWASKRVNGLPDCVCFIQGIGLARLAERVLGNPIPIANEHMPHELLR